MYSVTTMAHQETIPETLPALPHVEAVARLASIAGTMAALDRQIERCTDPRAESCLLALRVEHEVAYLETLYSWEYEGSEIPALR